MHFQNFQNFQYNQFAQPQYSQPQYIPDQAYLYFPNSNETKTPQGDRLIFDGNTQFDQRESLKIIELKDYANKHHYALSSIWTNGMILRFLYANGFKMDKTLQGIKEHNHWREKSLPVSLDLKLQQYLNSGVIYVSGRDNKFRPIVIFNVALIDAKHFDYNLITRYLTFWFEFIIQEYMLPGQVENWVFIVNLKGMKVSKSATDALKQVFSFLQENYKCRLYSLYMVNSSSSIYLPWKVIEKFLDEVTVNKIHFYKHPNPDALFTHANKEQVEQQFGGLQHNIVTYWPPQPRSNNFFVSSSDQQQLISVDVYDSLYKEGRLQNMKVNQSFIKKEQPQIPQHPQYEQITLGQEMLPSQDILSNQVEIMNLNPEIPEPQVEMIVDAPEKKLNDSFRSFSDYSEEPEEMDFNQCMNEDSKGRCEPHNHALAEIYKAESVVHEHELC